MERRRAQDAKADNIAAAFADWGIPTADSILMVRRAASRIAIIGSGGIRSGIDVAKVIALGAQAAGIAVPLLEPATVGVDDVVGVLEEIVDELRIAMFCIGADDLEALRDTPLLQRID